MALNTVPRKGQSVTREQLALNRAAGLNTATHVARRNGSRATVWTSRGPMGSSPNARTATVPTGKLT